MLSRCSIQREPVKLESSRHSIHADRDGMHLATSLGALSKKPSKRLPEVLSMNDVTRILSAVERGDAQAAEQLLPLVYDELRKLAAQRLAGEKPGQTLQATALVHEAYLRLVGADPASSWDSRGHFFAAAAEAMRRILVDQARRKRRPKHGGDRRRIDLDDALSVCPEANDDVLALDEALERLTHEEPNKAKLVKLHFFAGLSLEQAGAMLGISERTAKRHWAYARAWLYAAVRDRPAAAND